MHVQPVLSFPKRATSLVIRRSTCTTSHLVSARSIYLRHKNQATPFSIPSAKMEENNLPTLFEILNRFSKAPLDLWSFYVFLKEQYGGIEYLEFWLDCAAHTALCKEVARELMLKDDSQNTSTSPSRHQRTLNSSEDHAIQSPSSSVLFNMLQEEGSDEPPNKRRSKTRNSSSENGQSQSPQINRNSYRNSHSTSEEQDLFDNAQFNSTLNRFSSLSDERARNKRDTVSRLSEILDNLYTPEYPDAAATSPTRYAKLPQDISNEFDPVDDGYIDGPVDGGGNSSDEARVGSPHRYTRKNPQLPSGPPPTALTSEQGSPNPSAYGRPVSDPNSSGEWSHNKIRSPPSKISQGTDPVPPHQAVKNSANRRAVRDSAQQIINTYLSPKGMKEIELPSDSNGWSMAADIRQIGAMPGGLSNPKLFDSATTYVFEALEREALPAFLLHRGLSNVQPLSATIRLIAGLVSLFGGFWLSFVFVLLDWQPKSHRCWVILPFGVGMYLTITALYHIDPFLSFFGLGESDGGGVLRIQEKAVKTMLIKRSGFVLFTIVMCAAAFSVLFILVPGHRL